MKHKFRCSCPITSALDIVGDKWTLVIIKQMLFENKSTFKDFTESSESIATNILSTRLKQMEKLDIVEKSNAPNNLKTKLYTLTEKGLGLTPIVVELMLWSKRYIRDLHPEINLHPDLEKLEKDKTAGIQNIIHQYKSNILH